MTSDSETEYTQNAVVLPDGSEVTDNGPIVIVGPNGSGKTRRSRLLNFSGPLEVVSALRSTRISPQLQAMTTQDARTQYQAHRNNAKAQPYELASDFDFMLIELIGESGDVSSEYMRLVRAGENPDLPPLATLERVQAIWAKIFPGRELHFRDFRPLVRNTVAIGDEPIEYSAWEMSDGEKAALYLAGRVLSADVGIALLIDEPETHFHSLLAIRFWDLMQQARPDIRFVFATHDMTFAITRSAVVYLLANPETGLSPIDLDSDSEDLAAKLLGTASLSFFASKIIFCEGDLDSYDARLYSAWFSEKETVVQPVGSCDMVMRSVSTLRASRLVQNLTVVGIIDRDFHSGDRLATLSAGVIPLGVHEVESLFSLPGVVAAVARHLGKAFDADEYESKLVAKYTNELRHSVIIERWKTVIERKLGAVVSQVTTKSESIESITSSIPSIFNASTWDFDPQEILEDQKQMVEGLFSASDPPITEILRIMPGKPLLPLGPAAVELKPSAYMDLVIRAIEGEDEVLSSLGSEIREAIAPYIPTE